MPTYSLQLSGSIVVNVDNSPQETYSKSFSLTVKAKEKKDVIIPVAASDLEIKFSFSAATVVDALYIFSDQKITIRFVASTGTAIPIPANGFIIITDRVASMTGLFVTLSGATEAKVTIFAGEKST